MKTANYCDKKTKEPHNFVLSKDQENTGKIGVRKTCTKCGMELVFAEWVEEQR